jgi:glycosyltransferase involved in cell wall biosynthesis
VSQHARETYLEAGVPGHRVHAVALGADLELFAPGAARPAGAPLRVVFAGAAIERKGFDLLVDALERVLASDERLELRVIGPGGELLERASKLAPAAVSIVGRLSQRDLAHELAAADLLVLPSRNDSFGMVVPEALSCGTPVLVSDEVGARELVAPGRNGWIVPAGDVAALAERLLACAREPAAPRALREASRASARQASWSAYRERYADLIARLVAPVRT